MFNLVQRISTSSIPDFNDQQCLNNFDFNNQQHTLIINNINNNDVKIKIKVNKFDLYYKNRITPEN